jgi:hypothetical protein
MTILRTDLWKGEYKTNIALKDIKKIKITIM